MEAEATRAGLVRSKPVMLSLIATNPEVRLVVPPEAVAAAGPAEDRALLERCRAGDERAMQQLYTRHAGRLFALARRMTGSRADAEDVVQETFLRAWRSLDGFRGEAAVGTWLYRIALNRCRDAFARRRPTVPEVEGAAPPQAGDAMARRSLEAALGELPEGYREVLVLHDVMELEHPEIAAILGVEVGTSKSQLHKARSKMRELLAARGQAA